MGRNILAVLAGLALALANGCFESQQPETLNLETASDEVGPSVRVEPEWSGPDMQVWRFAKARGVHGNDFSKRTIGADDLNLVRDLPEEIPPIHAGPSATPELWVVRDGESLFTFDDARMAPVLMTDEAEALAKIFAGDLNWIPPDEIHAITQAQAKGVTTLSWIHNKRTYPPSNSDNWVKITVTASQEGTKTHSERLNEYVRPGTTTETPGRDSGL